MGVPIIPRNCPLYLLLDDNLPVQLPGDRGPDEITGIELSVHASQDKLSTILISWLAGEKGQGHESCSTDGSGSSSLSSPLSSLLQTGRNSRTRVCCPLSCSPQTPPGSRYNRENSQRNTQSGRDLETQTASQRRGRAPENRL